MPIPVSATVNRRTTPEARRLHRHLHHEFAVVGELDGVADQVDAGPGAADRGRRPGVGYVGGDAASQLEVLRVARRRSGSGSLQGFAQRKDAGPVDLARLDLGEIEDIVDDVSSDSAERLDHIEVVALLGVRSVSRASSVMPMIPFMGVRISWLMLARNSLLARLAARAASLALFLFLLGLLLFRKVAHIGGEDRRIGLLHATDGQLNGELGAVSP